MAFTWLGDEEFYLLALPLLYGAVSRRLGIRMGVMLLLTAGSNGVLKLAFVALVGWSRIHLGVRFLEDVLLGRLVGAVLVVLYLAFEGRVTAWVLRQRAVDQVLAAIVVSLAMIAPAMVLAGRLAGVTLPWPLLEDPVVAAGASHVVTPAATLAGFGIGLVLLARGGGFDHGGSIVRRVVRVLVGLVGVAVLWQGLGAVFPGGEEPLALLLRYVRYALVGAWVGGIAPLVFVRLGLASSMTVPGAPGDVALTRGRARLPRRAGPARTRARRRARSQRGSPR